MKSKTKLKKKLIIFSILVIVSFIVIQVIFVINTFIVEEKRTNTLKRLADIAFATTSYHEEYQLYPSGTAKDILDKLEGNNPETKVFLILPDHKDEWGKHFLLKPHTESSEPFFYSSGPNMTDDKCAESSDDIQYKPIKMQNKSK